MQSLTADEMDVLAPAAAPQRLLRRRFVLPKVFRRPARMLEKIEWRLPPFAGSIAVGLLFAVTLVGGVFVGGHAIEIVSAVTASSGLAIEEVRISGQSRTEELDVLHKLDLGATPSLVTFDLDAARTRVEALPWVAEATLRKLYPHDLAITIRERQPYAVWQRGDSLFLVDETGHPITSVVDASYGNLPMVVGEGAASRIGEYAALLAVSPAIAQRTRAGVLVAGRRWTLVLDSGVELMLPEEKPAAALATIGRLDADNGLLSRAITAVDLRDPNRPVVRLDAEGVAARTAFLKARAKGKAKT